MIPLWAIRNKRCVVIVPSTVMGLSSSEYLFAARAGMPPLPDWITSFAGIGMMAAPLASMNGRPLGKRKTSSASTKTGSAPREMTQLFPKAVNCT
jgi:hypothetical protein